MRTIPRILRLLAGPLALLCLSSSSALASPVTVQLRIEGSTKTLFEGPITTEPETFATKSSNGTHPCNYHENGTAGGFENEGIYSGTPTTALRDGALAAGLAFDATWYGSGAEKNGNPGDFFVTQVGSDINESSGSYASWGYAVNDLTAPVGGCQIALSPGSEVLWAYNYFNLEHRLKLAGPATADLGVAVTVHVTDGQTGSPLAGMSIGEEHEGVTSTIPSSPATNAQGEASIVLSHTGTVALKAQGPSAVRSNAVSICVHNGNDGTCQTTKPAVPPIPHTTQTPPPGPDVAEILGVAPGHIYLGHSAPRILRGEVKVPVGGTLRDVRISLERRAGGRCFAFSDLRARFVRSRCGTTAFFSVGSSLSFSYLLPARLPAGRYVYDIEALNSAGSPTPLSPGTSHVVFRVR